MTCAVLELTVPSSYIASGRALMEGHFSYMFLLFKLMWVCSVEFILTLDENGARFIYFVRYPNDCVVKSVCSRTRCGLMDWSSLLVLFFFLWTWSKFPGPCSVQWSSKDQLAWLHLWSCLVPSSCGASGIIWNCCWPWGVSSLPRAAAPSTLSRSKAGMWIEPNET